MSKPPYFDRNFMFSVSGVFKVFELLVLLTSAICILQYNTMNTEQIPLRELFFLCVCLSGLVFVVLIYWLKLFQMDRICCSEISLLNVWDIFILFVLAVLCIVASSLCVKLVHEHGNDNLWHFTHLLVAVVFCYIGAALFLVDSVLGLYNLVKRIRRYSSARKNYISTEGSFVVQNSNQ